MCVCARVRASHCLRHLPCKRGVEKKMCGARCATVVLMTGRSLVAQRDGGDSLLAAHSARLLSRAVATSGASGPNGGVGAAPGPAPADRRHTGAGCPSAVLLREAERAVGCAGAAWRCCSSSSRRCRSGAPCRDRCLSAARGGPEGCLLAMHVATGLCSQAREKGARGGMRAREVRITGEKVE